MLDWHPATEQPTTPGWYLLARDGSDRPMVCWWSLLSTQWRVGAQLVKPTHWAGPLRVPGA
jgi:hypothetical protein